MVYHNTVKYPIPDPRYGDESWRARHHFKEEHQHDAPFRRNRDFKPVPWGTARGMPNYRHSEPWLQMKNLYTLNDEHHHHPTKWIKRFLFGATIGFVLGQAWFFVSPINGFAAQKLFASIGERAWSGRMWRMFKLTAPRHMMYGGSAVLGYDLLREFLVHHDETNLRPKIIDHLFAMSVVGTIGGYMATNTFAGAFGGFLFFGLNVGFISYWWASQGMQPGSAMAPSHIYYEPGVSDEEKERIMMRDQIETLAYNMTMKPGYGLVDRNQSFQQ